MNRHYETLEYPKILERLAQYADFSGGKALAATLLPATDYREVRERLMLTREGRALFVARPDFTIGGVSDIRPLAEQAQHGVTLLPPDLLRVRDTLQGGARVRALLTRLETQFPSLADIAWRIHDLPHISAAVNQVLDDRGEVRDSASPALARIRRDLRISQDRIQERLRRMISSPHVGGYLQEPIVTRREGRFVLPVQTDFKGHVQGIVHDRSSSGATLFIEPLAVVELNNALRELVLAEEEEIFRILAELSTLVAQSSAEIVAGLDALAELDLVFARARYADEINATEPAIHPLPPTPAAPQGDNQQPGSVVRLHGARHPLLHPETVVPVNVDLDEDVHVVVITGPNTGGKTVTLKTVGLLMLMAQAGMHLPVDSGSALSCFETIYADIGDEQSIEQSLSTFSSHLANILSFLSQVDHCSLVLLDELGAGTDPAEGAALARALLEAFRTARVTAFVATHYPELKLYAHSTPGVRNASMEFSTETLSPTFRLTIGLPGRSNAFAIARRLGMPEAIVKQAQGMLTGEELRAEDMLDDLHNLRKQAALARDEARQTQRDLEVQSRTLQKRLAGFDEERRETLQRIQAEAYAEVETLREELRQLRARLLAVPQPELRAAVREAEAELDYIEETFVQDMVPEPTLETLAPLPERDAGPPRPGDTVRLLTLGIQGTLIELVGTQAVVQAGPARTRVALDELELVQRAAPPAAAERTVSLPARRPSPGIQLDLRGLTVEEALERLESYLDAATGAGLPWVRIVHGKGTGALRREVRHNLGTHPLVTSYESAAENEGGEGATVVHLVQMT